MAIKMQDLRTAERRKLKQIEMIDIIIAELNHLVHLVHCLGHGKTCPSVNIRFKRKTKVSFGQLIQWNQTADEKQVRGKTKRSGCSCICHSNLLGFTQVDTVCKDRSISNDFIHFIHGNIIRTLRKQLMRPVNFSQRLREMSLEQHIRVRCTNRPQLCIRPYVNVPAKRRVME